MDDRALSQKISPKTFLNYLENKKTEEMDAIRDAIDMEMLHTSALLKEARDAKDEELVQQLKDKQKNLTRKRRDTWVGVKLMDD